MKWITFTRPFSFINYDGYYYPPAIVAFGRRPIEMRRTEKPTSLYTYTIEPSRYCYDLKINLWLVEFYFTWERNV
jgi:hypothetical protein